MRKTTKRSDNPDITHRFDSSDRVAFGSIALFLGVFVFSPPLVIAANQRDALRSDYSYCVNLRTSQPQRNATTAPRTSLACQYVMEKYVLMETPQSYLHHILNLDMYPQDHE
ncbi:TPA: hypothetical protein HA241_02565 [Candidatus Woesearchaeota archaeon]|nr:hypothetical protein [Candidatus Woesearchaeota archaeon]